MSESFKDGASEVIMTKFKSQALHIIRIKISCPPENCHLCYKNETLRTILHMTTKVTPIIFLVHSLSTPTKREAKSLLS
jgi:hypothetical protein